MHFIKTHVSSRKFNDVNSKSKMFLWNKWFTENILNWKLCMLLLKFAGTIDEVWQFFKTSVWICSCYSFSKKNRPLVSSWILLSWSFWSKRGTPNESLVRSEIFFWLLAELLSLSHWKEAKKAQTQMHSTRPLIGLKCPRIRIWSDFPDRIDLWSDLSRPN